jgi:hypothetical protein
MVSRKLYSPDATQRHDDEDDEDDDLRRLAQDNPRMNNLEMYVPPMQTTSHAMSHHPMSIMSHRSTSEL